VKSHDPAIESVSRLGNIMQPIALLPISLAEEYCPNLAFLEVEGVLPFSCQVERMARAQNIAGLLVVTTVEGADDAIAAFCAARGLDCHRGPKGDWLGLLVHALEAAGRKGAILVRPDSPLIDPAVVDHVANLVELTDGMLDFVGTTLAPTYPQGMDVEGFTLAALKDSHHRCADPGERTDATLYLRSHSKLYRILSVKPEAHLHRPELSLALRGPEDLPRYAAIRAHFNSRPDYTMAELIAFLDGSA